MKTAMQEFYTEIEKFEKDFKTDFISIADLKRSIRNYYSLKEKQQIIEAYDLGMGHYGGANCKKDAEQYYNETFS